MKPGHSLDRSSEDPDANCHQLLQVLWIRVPAALIPRIGFNIDKAPENRRDGEWKRAAHKDRDHRLLLGLEEARLHARALPRHLQDNYNRRLLARCVREISNASRTSPPRSPSFLQLWLGVGAGTASARECVHPFEHRTVRIACDLYCTCSRQFAQRGLTSCGFPAVATFTAGPPEHTQYPCFHGPGGSSMTISSAAQEERRYALQWAVHWASSESRTGL